MQRTRGDNADAVLADELHAHPRLRVAAFKVEDELRQVFNAIDVVVRRRRDEADAGRAAARARNVTLHLLPWQLTTLARLCALH